MSLTKRPMSQVDGYRTIRRWAAGAGGKLEVAQQTANHESARTTGLRDRRNDRVSPDEVERILI
jgi:hypothetical protein